MHTVQPRPSQFVIIDPPEVVAEKMRLPSEANRRHSGERSLCDEFHEDRRRERERELREEGW
jgi:hypothetical protein